MKNFNFLFVLMLGSISFSNLSAAHSNKPMSLEDAQRVLKYYKESPFLLGNEINQSEHAQALAIVEDAVAAEELKRIAKAKQTENAAKSAAACTPKKTNK